MSCSATRFAPVGLVYPIVKRFGTLIRRVTPVVRSISMAIPPPKVSKSARRPSPDHATASARFIGPDPAPLPGHVVMTYRAPTGDTRDIVAVPPLRAGPENE